MAHLQQHINITAIAANEERPMLGMLPVLMADTHSWLMVLLCKLNDDNACCHALFSHAH